MKSTATITTYSLVSMFILILLSMAIAFSLIQNIAFYKRELRTAFPSQPIPTLEFIDRTKLANITKTINFSSPATYQHQENPQYEAPIESANSAVPPPPEIPTTKSTPRQ